MDEDIYKIFLNVDDDIENILGSSHPKNFCLKAWPIIPTCCRPCNKVCGIVKEDDLTKLLNDIIKANNAIKTNPNKEFAINNLKIKIENYCKSRKQTNNIGQNKYTNVCEMLKGKQGIIRMNLMGKRTDMCARMVIGPGPNLKIDEVGIPLKIAESVSFPITVLENNIKEIYELIKSKKIKQLSRDGNIIRLDLLLMKNISSVLLKDDVVIRNGTRIIVPEGLMELKKGDRIFRNNKDITPSKLPELELPKLNIGDIVHRVLQDGDWVLMNRQQHFIKEVCFLLKQK